MSKTTPEFEKANAELKRAREAAAQATFQKWEIYGMPWKLRFKLMFLTGNPIFYLCAAGYMLWSAYESQQKWNLLIQKRPELETIPHPNYTLGMIWPLILIALCYPQFKKLATIYRETDGFIELRKETALFMILGVVLALLLAATWKYWLTFILKFS